MALTAREVEVLDYVIARVPAEYTPQFLASIRGNDDAARAAIAGYKTDMLPQLNNIIDSANGVAAGAQKQIDLLNGI